MFCVGCFSQQMWWTLKPESPDTTLAVKKTLPVLSQTVKWDSGLFKIYEYALLKIILVSFEEKNSPKDDRKNILWQFKFLSYFSKNGWKLKMRTGSS